MRSPSPLIRFTTRVSRRRRRPPLVVVAVDVVVVSWPRRVRLTNLVPPSLRRSLLSPPSPCSFPPFLPRSISVRYASLPVHPPTHETARSRASTLSPPACTPAARSLLLRRLFSFSLSPRDAFTRLLSPRSRLHGKKKKKKKGKKEGTKESFSRVLSSFFFPLSSFSCRRSFVRSFGQSRPTRATARLSAIIFCPIVRSYVRACVRVFACAIADRRTHTHTRAIFLVSLLCTRVCLPSRRHRRARSYSSSLLSIWSSLRYVRSFVSFLRPRSPVCAVYIRESRRQRSDG